MKTNLALLLIAFTLTANSQVRERKKWITSNVGTHDMLNLFSQPQKWAKTRAKLNGIKFYDGQLFSNREEDCMFCESNVYPNFVQRNAFEMLKDWGYEIAVEIGALKEWDCDARILTEHSVDFLRSMKQKGVDVDHFALDEPLASGMASCNQSVEQTATYVNNYYSTVKAAWREYFPDREPSIGHMEPYPHMKMSDIVREVQLLVNGGNTPAFFHLDLDWWAIRGKKMSDSVVRRDLQMLRKVCNDNGIALGFLFWGHGGKPAEQYKDFVEQAKRFKKWYGIPADFVFQSWERTKVNGQEVNRIPDNLPESNRYSLTGIALTILAMFKL
jgi:hypothetical protein